MTRTMYDSVTAQNIPTTAEVVAGYINGKWKWTQKDWDRFPHAEKVRIQVYIPGQLLTNNGHVLDVEANDVNAESVGMAIAWSAWRKRAGIRPCIYTSKSTVHAFANVDCDFWIADYTGKPHLLPGSVATQYDNPGPYDLSLVMDGWPYKEGKPMPNAPMAALRITKSGNGYWLIGKDGGVFAYGDAKFYGSPADKPLAAPINTFDVMPNEDGYILGAEDYGVFAYGTAKFLGSPRA